MLYHPENITSLIAGASECEGMVPGNEEKHTSDVSRDHTFSSNTLRALQGLALHTRRNTIASFIMPSISHLPTEMLCSIASLLEAQDFFSFRQTSRVIQNSTISQFATQYFKRRYILLQRHSLEALINIARHPVFGPTVHTLDISIAHITGAPAGDVITRPAP